jgi:cytochrome c oxidase assembly protein subunit 15
MTSFLRSDRSRPVAIWLFIVAALVLGMVVVGGATRLTDSGLSITQWKPIMGALPPMSEAAWRANFELYKQIPQYRLVNAGMTWKPTRASSGGSGRIGCWAVWSARRSPSRSCSS